MADRRSSPDVALARERDLLKEELNKLRVEVRTLKTELERTKNAIRSESSPTLPKVRSTESIAIERIQGSSASPTTGAHRQEDIDLPRVHSGKLHQLASHASGDFDDAFNKSQVGCDDDDNDDGDDDILSISR